MDHEADDQERPELQLAEREGRSDRETLAEVMDTDSDCDEQRQREPACACTPARKAPREEGHAEGTQRHPEQHEPGAAEPAGQSRLQRERFGERLDRKEREQTGRERHERCQPPGIGSS